MAEITVGTTGESLLLGTLEEISRLVVSHAGDATETLANIARLIQRQFRSDVCSVYLLEPDRLHLVCPPPSAWTRRVSAASACR